MQNRSSRPTFEHDRHHQRPLPAPAVQRRPLASAADVRTSLTTLREDYPALYRSVCDETGAIRRHVNVFVNNDNVKGLGGLDTVLGEGDEVSIIHAVSGG